jgi:hypothetical protein
MGLAHALHKPILEASVSGVGLTEALRPHLGPDLVDELVDHIEHQTILKDDLDLQRMINK